MRLRKHALIRLCERCRLSPQDIRHILENDLYYPIGIDGKKQHQLIYSEKDDECFVLVQDTTNEEIVTVLPINYHNAWEIHEDAIEMAKDIYIKSQQKTNISPKKEEASLMGIRNINIYAHILSVAKMTVRPYDGKLIPKGASSKDVRLLKIKVEGLVGMGLPPEIVWCKDSFLNALKDEVFSNNLKDKLMDAAEGLGVDTSSISGYAINLAEFSKTISFKPSDFYNGNKETKEIS